MNHHYIGTEHILLGLVHEGDGLAAKALESLGISLEAVRGKVEEMVPRAGGAPTGSPPFTPRAKKVLELSLREALQLGHNYIGTEHMLLGLVREGEGVAARVLQDLGADLDRTRQQVIELLSGYTVGEPRAGAVMGPQRTLAPSGHPTRVIPGGDRRLVSEGVEFRVTGVLGYADGFEVLWRLSGIPSAVADLVEEVATIWEPRSGLGYGPIRGRPNRRVGGERTSYLSLSDDKQTVYVASQTDFEPQPDGDWAGRTYFTPHIADSAERLIVIWQREPLDLNL